MNDKVYVFGHKKPDTDSVTSAIAVAYLKRQLGLNSEPRVLGSLNKESKFVLNYFKIEEPKYLDSVKLQIKDVDYYKGYSVSEYSTIIDTYNYLQNKQITGTPVVDSNNILKGIITLKDITRKLIDNNENYICTTYENVIKVLNGEQILRCNEKINGQVLVASYNSDEILNNIKFNQNDILVVGNREQVIKYAINSKLGTLIVVGNCEIKNEYIEVAKQNNINVIKTNFNSLKTAKNLELSDHINKLSNNKHFCKFNEDCNFYEFIKEANKYGHNNYPVVDKNDICLGLIRVTDNNTKHPKKVILVDHNEREQSVDGLDEADIIEVVDHHNISNISTGAPINFRTMSVGCTNTIVYQMYQEQDIQIPYRIAGLMLSGILSDTLGLTSSTTTELDIKTVNELSEYMAIDYNEYYKKMLKAGTSLSGLTKLEVLTQDYKQYQTNDKKYAVSQVITLDIDNLMKDKDKYLKLMEQQKVNKDLELLVFIITDALANGSYILYTNGCEEMFQESFNLKNVRQGMFVPNMVSRKKQVIPYIDLYFK